MENYFSINADYLPEDYSLEFPIFINSSVSKVTHFVKVVAPGTSLSRDQISSFVKKYSQLYLLEEDRHKFLDLAMKSKKLTTAQGVGLIQQNVGQHFSSMSNSENDPKLLAQLVDDCGQMVTHLVDVVETSKSLDDIKNLITQLSFHDHYTFDHSLNVSMYSIAFYKHLYPFIDKRELVLTGLSGLLHDLGKLFVSTAVINKPGDLSSEEFKIIQTHPTKGKEIFTKLIPMLGKEVDWNTVMEVMYQHHENYDGKGYPLGLKNEKINERAKICMLADIFDALTTKRSYNEAMTTEKALEIMYTLVGKKIDPQLFQRYANFASKPVNFKNANLSQTLDGNFDPSTPFNVLGLKPWDAKDAPILEKKSVLGKVHFREEEHSRSPINSRKKSA
ncbi:MAG: HD domain-containing phosphohydrolase [Bacteriovoracaceae bacterium]|nr:HD domain-containing phosphohydrolase [Bacteriovoracaceae bacterium]